MALVSLELFKQHVRSDDFAGDDEYLAHLLEVAETAVANATQRTLADLTAADGTLPAPLRHAVMMLAAHWYNQRESVSTAQMHEVPSAVDALVKPYRRLVHTADTTGTGEEAAD